MDAVTPLEQRFLPAVANAVVQWFPELEGRSVAVSDVDITRENIPTLPLVLVAFTRSVGDQLTRSVSEEFKITDTFIIDFWLAPERVKARGKETPYWNYYPYEYVRDKLITGFLDWEGPRGEHVAYKGLQVAADPLAARLTFTFVSTFQWCTMDVRKAEKFDIGFRLCTPKACVPECEDLNPCPEPCP